MVQRPFHFAIVDEVDSILIDEARTPLIISGPTDDKSELYIGVDAIVKQFAEDDYEKDEKQRSVVLTEDGTEKAERMLEEAGLIEGRNLYDIANTQVVHHLNQALKANVMFKKDIDYIVKDGKVVIIDEFTGRMMDGRRWSDGLHQAVEAKEGVKIEPENQTLASITFQNYFRMYPKLSGMTGTAMTEAPEFFDIYRMNVVSIPTNVDVLRQDDDDVFYKTMVEKFAAITDEIRAKQEIGQPVLVGTVSIEKSEVLSEYLEQGRDRAQGAQRPLPRERGAYRRPGRAAWARSPSRPTWPAAAPTSSLAATSISGCRTSIRSSSPERPNTRPRPSASAARSPRSASACSTPAACSCSAPSATKAGASTTSCAAARAARATPACRASTSASTTICCASSARRRCSRG